MDRPALADLGYQVRQAGRGNRVEVEQAALVPGAEAHYEATLVGDGLQQRQRCAVDGRVAQVGRTCPEGFGAQAVELGSRILIDQAGGGERPDHPVRGALHHPQPRANLGQRKLVRRVCEGLENL
ncbi:MAG: hypothetical protein R2724_02355 [Bryobacterales bacterium]